MRSRVCVSIRGGFRNYGNTAIYEAWTATFFFRRSAIYIALLDDISSSHEDNEVSAIITGNDTRLPVANQFALAFMVASPAARPVVRGIVVGIMVALPGREHHDYPTTHAHTPSRLLTTAIREGSGLDHPRIVLATTTITTTTALLLLLDFAAVAGNWNWPPYYRSLLPSALFRTSGIRRIKRCTNVSTNPM